MKKFFKAALFMATLALGVNVLNAETMDLKDIDTNTLIVGDRVFEGMSTCPRQRHCQASAQTVGKTRHYFPHEDRRGGYR